MNQVIQGTVNELERRYKDKTDEEVIQEIRVGEHAGEALFYLLFGRYAEMLLLIFNQQTMTIMDFDDFMLELDIKLYAQTCAVIRSFDPHRASFKTYLSRIARNLAYDLQKKDFPMLAFDFTDMDMPADDSGSMMMLVDAINSYPNKDSRYVLYKTIEGYKSKEIASMLSCRRHEDGTLAVDQALKSSYIDTLRSRALKAIRRSMAAAKNESLYGYGKMDSAVGQLPILSDLSIEQCRTESVYDANAAQKYLGSSLFINLFRDLYNQMLEG